MVRKIKVLKPTVKLENNQDDYACHDGIMELTTEKTEEIYKLIEELNNKMKSRNSIKAGE